MIATKLPFRYKEFDYRRYGDERYGQYDEAGATASIKDVKNARRDG
jgi:hypothetical protein